MSIGMRDRAAVMGSVNCGGRLIGSGGMFGVVNFAWWIVRTRLASNVRRPNRSRGGGFARGHGLQQARQHGMQAQASVEAELQVGHS